jgi:hypothetical protein
MNKNDWRMSLDTGDEITIDTGDNELPPSIIILTIEYLPGETVRIIDTDGNRHECLLNEIN